MAEFDLMDVPAEIAVPVLDKRRTALYQQAVDCYAITEALGVQSPLTGEEEDARVHRIEEMKNSSENALAGAQRIGEIIKGIQQARIASGLQVVALTNETGINGGN